VKANGKDKQEKLDADHELATKVVEDIFTAQTEKFKEQLTHWLPKLADANVSTAAIIIIFMNLSLSLGTLPIELLPIVLPDQKLDHKFLTATLVNQYKAQLEGMNDDKNPTGHTAPSPIILPH